MVDGDWKPDPTAPTEVDDKGNVNNVLTPDQIIKEASPASAMMNTVTPESTTAQLAKDVPLEKKEDAAHAPEAGVTPSDFPGGFPITPADELDKPIGINPLPAADAGLNPVKLAPGEKPAQATQDEINKNVKLDKESYEKSDALPGIEDLPPKSDNMIPESSLPISEPEKKGEVTILPIATDAKDPNLLNTVTPESTTAALAGQVPLEPKVPKVVKESQEKAGVDPEASAVPEEVKEKAAVEAELKKVVPEVPAAASNTASATFAAFSKSVTAAANTAVEKATPIIAQAQAVVTGAAANLPDSVKQKLPGAAQEAIGTQTKEETREKVSPEVPEAVKQSIQESGKAPEAAANTEAVQEKAKVESELQKEVKLVPAEGEGSKTEAKPAEDKPVAPEGANGAEAAEAKNGTASKEAEKARKKKNRASVLFSKLKNKLSHKEK